jgi:hypothetical protein
LRTAVSLAAALAGVLGCGPSPQMKSEVAARTLQSWTETVRKTSDAFERGAVPALYGRQVVEAAMKSKQEQAASPEWNSLPADDRAALDDAIHKLAASIGPSARQSTP